MRLQAKSGATVNVPDAYGRHLLAHHPGKWAAPAVREAKPGRKPGGARKSAARRVGK